MFFTGRLFSLDPAEGLQKFKQINNGRCLCFSSSWSSSLHIEMTDFLHKRTVCNSEICAAAQQDNRTEHFVWNIVWQLLSDTVLWSWLLELQRHCVFLHFKRWEWKESCCSFLRFLPSGSFSVPLSLSPSLFFPASFLSNCKSIDLLHPWGLPNTYNTFRTSRLRIVWRHSETISLLQQTGSTLGRRD